MRWLTCVALLAFVSPVRAADKDEDKSAADKAKEVVAEFLKAVKAKDLDALMKTVDVPFLAPGSAEPVTKLDDLKMKLKGFLEKDADPEKVPTETGMVLDMAAVRKKVEGKDKDKFVEQLEAVAGKTGLVVMVAQDGKERGAVLVRVKDGKAKVVGLPK